MPSELIVIRPFCLQAGNGQITLLSDELAVGAVIKIQAAVYGDFVTARLLLDLAKAGRQDV